MTIRHAFRIIRAFPALALGLMLILLLCGCDAEKKTEDPIYTRLEELEYARIGVTTGSVQAMQAEARFPNAKLFFFSSTVDCIEAMRAGKIDAVVDPEPLLRYMMAENPDLVLIDEPLAEKMQVASAFPKTDRGRMLCGQFSEYILGIKQNGVYDEVRAAWFGADESLRTVSDPSRLPGPNGTLRVAVDTSVVPFAYVKDGMVVGYDADMVVRFCKEYGYRPEFIVMDFSGIIPSIISGKCDFGSGGIAVTAERAESILFSEPTYEGGSVVAVLKAPETQEEGGIVRSILLSFEKTFLRENRWKLFLTGIGNTLLITLLAMLFGTLLGFAVYLLCRKGGVVANRLTAACIWLVEGMPMVVLLMILYYIIFRSAEASGLTVAVIGFTLTFGASMFGMLRSGVKAVDSGQTEAAHALGYTDRMTFFRIILPQAVQHFMPAYRGQVVSLLKATAVVGYIAVQDLTKMGDIVRSRTYEAFFPLIAVAVIYFLLAGILTRAVGWLIGNIDPKNRRPEQILKGVDQHD